MIGICGGGYGGIAAASMGPLILKGHVARSLSIRLKYCGNGIWARSFSSMRGRFMVGFPFKSFRDE